jgi:putative addiction module component (TIGR02574 family)
VHIAEELWQRHGVVAPYPEGVLAVPRPIPGTAFFPGGFGLWRPDGAAPLPAFPVNGVMVLGHDFHSETGYEASLARGRESPTQPTWLNLIRLLEQVAIPPEACFFTNVYMGLRAGRQTTGVFPGAHNSAFVERCRRFLAEQLAVQRPRLILTLGVYAPRVLAPLSPQLADWRDATGFKTLDHLGPLRRGVRFPGADGVEATVVALTHPCLRHAAVRHRTYNGMRGHAAELAMIEDARTMSARARLPDDSAEPPLTDAQRGELARRVEAYRCEPGAVAAWAEVRERIRNNTRPGR